MTHPKSVDEILKRYANVYHCWVMSNALHQEDVVKALAQAKQSLLKLILEHPTRPRFSDDDEVWGDEITRIYDTFLRELMG